MDPSMKRLLAGIAAVFALAAPAAAQFGPQGPPAVGVMRAERRPMTETSEFVGRIEATDRVNMGTELEFVIMVIAVSCVKLLSAHNSTQHTSRKHKV
jgi:hypothetical protein